ncbi:acyltransferase [Diplocloster hominis]|uniref:acyltransferase n=1 Tax=Diplocloster hominis TaxID=3079010 RepID=UPI0031B9AD18
MSEQVRKSNFELLRIVSILVITLSHISLTYGIENTNTFIRYCAQFFFIGGKLGVNCYVLITGYFMYNKRFDLKRILKLYLMVIFYTFILLIVGFIFIPETISFKGIIESLLPIITNHYWFITSYIGLICLTPFINKLVAVLDKKAHSMLIVVGLVLLTIIPTMTTFTPYNSDLLWFIFLYILAAFFRKYDGKIKRMLSHGYIFIITTGIMWCGSIIFSLLSNYISFFSEGINFLAGQYILTQLINSCSLFLWFEKKKIFSPKINFLAKYTLASYLIQSNYIMIPLRIGLCNNIFQNTSIYLYPIFSVLLAIVLFGVAVAIDHVRERLTDPINNKLYKYANHIVEKICSKIEPFIEEE